MPHQVTWPRPPFRVRVGRRRERDAVEGGALELTLTVPASKPSPASLFHPHRKQDTTMPPLLASPPARRAATGSITGRLALTVVLVLLSTASVVVGGATAAVAASLGSTPLITYNMQGSSSGSDSKWTTTVGAYARSAEIVALQEVGGAPPGDLVGNIVFDPNAPGRAGYVQHNRWRFGQESYEVYFLQTDANGGSYVGGRNNVALVTQRGADEVTVVSNPGGRAALGVRFGDNWYFTFHGLALGGRNNDSADMAQRIAAAAGGRQWTMIGDFNMEPGSFAAPARSYRYNPGTATHQGGGEYDYALSSENIPDLPVRTVPGASADHYAVGIGAMRAAAEPKDLRIMPLGDSITFGEGSSNGAGYRGRLWEELKAQNGTTVNFVGSQHSGPIPDNDNEGHPGWLIGDIDRITDNALATYQPNVVLLHIGTNDMNRDVDPAGAPGRLGSLIDRIFRDSPDVTLLVSQLVPSSDPAVEGRIFTYNHSIPDVVAQRQNAGKHVWMVNMDTVTVGDLVDVLHPNDTGYRKMGHVFYDGIRAVEEAGWVKPPPSGGGGGGDLGAPNWFAQGNIASGFGAQLNPDPQPGGQPYGDRSAKFLADLNGDGRDDYVMLSTYFEVTAWLNGGNDPAGSPTWNHLGQIGPGVAINGRVVFADINGDGRSDYLVVGDTGWIQAWLNGGPSASSPSGWAWNPAGQVAPGVGVPGARVQFADVTGDGRDDYLVVGAGDGSVTLWQNGGPSASSPSGWAWDPRGRIAPGVGVPGSSVLFAHLHGRVAPNNNAREDYLVMDEVSGRLDMWLNAGPPGGSGDWNWNPLGRVADGERGRVLFANIDGDPRADYVYLAANGAVYAWVNGGPDKYWWYYKGQVAPGVGVPGREVRFADVDGDGFDDYVVVNPTTGSLTLWYNHGPAASSPSGWAWDPHGRIAPGVGAPGGQVQLADVDGDKKADYLVMGPSNGSVNAWLNAGYHPGSPSDNWDWNPIGAIAPGVGSPASHIRLARLYIYPGDTVASRRVDYLDVQDDSSVRGWQNAGPSASSPSGWAWNPQGVIAAGVPAGSGGTMTAPGSQIHFADINGDGRDDYLDIDPANGAVWAWTNTEAF
ncbi:FG-GAP-like repeat-containing protein [Sphaerisporangium rhizosphaerae]|uniref:FG-GAP-like repeat-containing protein n=1 Tax=Sphaerisporangium rhizosphaerae TaxID=2269375 RepID=A0ABW2PA74_9ACTN